MYKLHMNRKETKELAISKWLILVFGLAGMLAVVWLAWVRPAQQSSNINNFSQCQAAGNSIQESYPEVCLTPNGKRFVNPKQSKAHQEYLDGAQEVAVPSDEEDLFLDIDEWGIRIPFEQSSFDLTYSYIENGAGDSVKFGYKRLVAADMCSGDVGIDLTRLMIKREPPYGDNNPEPLAKSDNYYYYASTKKEPCYDPDNTEHLNLIKEIAGDQDLIEVTTKTIKGLTAIPEQQ